MVTITKKTTFDCSHYLENHPGLCKNLHGHTYHLEVSVTGDVDPTCGMVLDFSEVKHHMEKYIADKFDHAYVTNSYRNNDAIATIAKAQGMKVVELHCEPTAENMAKWIFDELNWNLRTGMVTNVRLYETPTSYVDYSGEVD